MSSEIWCAIISGAVALVGSLTTWRVTARKDQDETRKQLKAEIDGLKEDVSGIEATFQQHIAVIDVKIDTLSERVEKHNNVIERTYKLEQAVEDMKKAM